MVAKTGEYWNYGDGEIKLSLCGFCKFKLPGSAKCSVFPQGIPDVFLDSKEDHVIPYPGDGGQQFVAADDAKLPASVQKRADPPAGS